MQQPLNKEKLKGITYIVGDEDTLVNMSLVSPLKRFDDRVIDFLDKTSKKIMTDKRSRQYPDVITLAFWMRKASVLNMIKEYPGQEGRFYVGRGMIFHIAPSNVPVNYMYSLITGLLSGNANVVKIPSKDFEQLPIINEAIKAVIEENPEMKPYIVLVRYGHEQDINDALSEFADGRVIWGGDNTISEIRKSPMGARAVEIAFADRYSLAVIDSDAYLAVEDKQAVARDFFNDTYLTDQNACTSPRIVVWSGIAKEDAKKEFWKELHSLLSTEYELQPVQAVNKLTSGYILAAHYKDVVKGDMPDNLITRMGVPSLDEEIINFKDSCGYFMEFDCDDMRELKDIANNTHCQTLSYLGDISMFDGLLEEGIKGIDRIVPMGKTMDFEFTWDGYNLIELLSRIVRTI